MRGQTISPYLWMLAGSFWFSVMGTLAHEAGQKCEWQVVALFRSLLVVVFVGGHALAAGTPLVFWRPRILWIRSFAGSLSLLCTFYALTHSHVPTVLTLTNTFPVWVAVLSWPMLGIFPSLRVWIAVLCAVTGVWLMKQPQADETALIVALFAALATAVAMLGLHRLRDIHPAAVVVHFALVATAFCIGSFFLFPWTPGPMSFWNWQPMLLLLGVGASASLGQLFLTKAFALGDPSKISVVGLTQVVFALLIDLTREFSIEWRMLLGMALIIGPTAWVMRRHD